MYFLIYLLVLVVQISAKPLNCPHGCVCDHFEELRRVKCSNRNFWSIGSAFPKNVQVVDVSYNQITELGNYQLLELGLHSLKLLNISHNKLAHMHINAFRGMDAVKTIDLSYNSLEYLQLDWFYDLPNLKELYLSNNNFGKLPDVPLIDSKYLKVLDLSNSRISHLRKSAFSQVPVLEKLYLDGNLLLQVNVEIIANLKQLKLLSIKDNPLVCDSKTITELKAYCKKHGIRLKDSCSSKPKPEQEKFQRMVVLEEFNDENDDKNSWISDEEEVEQVTETTCKQMKEDKGLLMDIIEISPILALIIPFVVGCLTGIILVCTIPIHSRKNQNPKQRRRHSIIRRNFGEIAHPLVLNCENIYESTPVPQRRIDMYSQL